MRGVGGYHTGRVSKLEPSADPTDIQMPLRSLVVPVLCLAASLHALYTRVVLIGADPEVPAEVSTLGLGVYLTVQTLIICCVYHGASVTDHVVRWRLGSHACPRLTASVHFVTPLVLALSIYLLVAFYALVWRDTHFQQTAVLPKVRQTMQEGGHLRMG